MDYVDYNALKVYAVKLVELLPERFFFKQNADWWFVRDETWQMMDLSSKTPKHDSYANTWQFVGRLCKEYGVRHINALENEPLEEAAFRELLNAISSVKTAV